MKDQLTFDTSDAGTITDSDKTLAGIISTDGSTLITDTLEGGKQGLDVYLINTEIDVNTNAEKAEDAAHSSGDTGNFVLAVRNDTEGTLVDTDGDYAPLQVDASGRLRVIADIDVSVLSEKNEDDAHGSGDTGDYVLAVRADARPTNANTSADGDYASFFVNTNGELYVKATDTDALLTTIDADTSSIATDASTIAGDTTSIDTTLSGLSHIEDSAHVSGDTGIMGLAVRNDTLGSLADTDGDYTPFQVNASGELYVAIESEIDVNDTANTAIANTNTIVGLTATDLVGTDLANRKYAFVANLGNKKIFVGGSGVTVANGFPVSPGSALELRAGAAIDLHAIKAAGGAANDTRILELS